VHTISLFLLLHPKHKLKSVRNLTLPLSFVVETIESLIESEIRSFVAKKPF